MRYMKKRKVKPQTKLYNCSECKVSWGTSKEFNECPFCQSKNITRTGTKYKDRLSEPEEEENGGL
jgi:hypothetical protein